MAKDDRGERLGSLELEPLPGEKPVTGKAVFHPNTRDKGSERRRKDERRTDIRTQSARRTRARRPTEPWDSATKPR